MDGAIRRRCSTFAAALAVCCLAGCTDERRDGDADVFTFAVWAPAAVFLAGSVMFVLGVKRITNSVKGRWILMILGVVAGFGLAPSLLTDRVTVDPQGFTLRTGLWFAPTAHEVKFADLSAIELTAESRRTRRGRSTSYYLVCVKKSGGSERVPVGTLMQQGPRDRILERATEAGVSVVDRM